MHGGLYSLPATITLHDADHELANVLPEEGLNNLIFGLMQFIRNITGYHWSCYLWYVLDSMFEMKKVQFFRCLLTYRDQFFKLSTVTNDENFLVILYYVDNLTEWNTILGDSPYLHDTDKSRAVLVEFVRRQVMNKIRESSLTRKDAPRSVAERLFIMKQEWQSFSADKVVHLRICAKDDQAQIDLSYTNLTQNLGFLKITKKLVEKFPELAPYLHHVQLVSYMGAHPPVDYDAINLDEYLFTLDTLR